MIKSKRHHLKFYFSIIAVTLFLLGMATVLLFVYTKLLEKGEIKIKDNLMPFFSIGCYVAAGYNLYRYIKNAPIITIDNDFISFNNETFALSDIKTVALTGKKAFKYVINVSMEAATLTFNNGDTKYIFDDMYSNSWEIKSFLKQVVIDKKDFVEPTGSSIDISSLDHEYYETYKGSAIMSFRGFLLWGFIGFFAYMLLTDKKLFSIGIIILIGAYSVFWFLLHCRFMNYFQVSDNFFIVRNHNLFWIKKAYHITDIKEIVFETQGKMPNCLRIITKDFKNKLYPAGTLRNKTWLELKEKLETYKIEVRNECI